MYNVVLRDTFISKGFSKLRINMVEFLMLVYQTDPSDFFLKQELLQQGGILSRKPREIQTSQKRGLNSHHDSMQSQPQPLGQERGLIQVLFLLIILGSDQVYFRFWRRTTWSFRWQAGCFQDLFTYFYSAVCVSVLCINICKDRLL